MISIIKTKKKWKPKNNLNNRHTAKSIKSIFTVNQGSMRLRMIIEHFFLFWKRRNEDI